MEISLCMIVKNEEKVLDNCLQSMNELVEEIVIIDTGSTDRTKEIAARYTDKIYDYEWIDDFAAARNYSFSKASKEYVMWMDADDILKPENRETFINMKKKLDPNTDAVLMPYHCNFSADGRVMISLGRERIVRRNAGFIWKDEIHEYLNVSGNIIACDVAITHTGHHSGSDRNLLILERIMKKGNPALKTLFYYAEELSMHDREDEAIACFEDFFAQGGRELKFCMVACLKLHDIYVKKREYENALRVSSECMDICGDKPEYCCQLGYYYTNVAKDYDEAVFWFDRASKCPRPKGVDHIIQEEYYYYVPFFQLGSVLCKQHRYNEALVNFKEALKYHEGDRELQSIINRLAALVNYKEERAIVNKTQKE